MHISINGDQKICTMVYEIFKTLNNLNLVFMKDIFHYSPNVTCKKQNLYIHTQNTTKFGNKSLRAFGANIWNITWKQNTNAMYANENETSS